MILLHPSAGNPAPRAATPSDLFRYRVLGGVLASAMEFPELAPAAAAAPCDWSLETCPGEPPSSHEHLVGARTIGAESYRLHKGRTGFRIEYSHAGSFAVSDQGASIRWYRGGHGNEELARAIVLGPALALALELRGHLCLHGSAVEVDGSAIAFLGPKFHGKSTLATALTAAGARLITDDLVAVRPGAPVTVRPGIPSVRLWCDAAERLDVGRLCETVVPGVKTTAAGFGQRVMTEENAPLAAIYLLSPTGPGVGDPCRRRRLEGAGAAIALAHQTKLPPPLVGAAAAGAQLRRAAATATTVPVWELEVQRDFDRLPEVVSSLLEWHSAESGRR